MTMNDADPREPVVNGDQARPYICLLIILVLVLTPSVRPLWCGIVSAAVAARAATWLRDEEAKLVAHDC
jgi:hypothetical protein